MRTHIFPIQVWQRRLCRSERGCYTSVALVVLGMSLTLGIGLAGGAQAASPLSPSVTPLNLPAKLAVGSNGALYVADFANSRVLAATSSGAGTYVVSTNLSTFATLSKAVAVDHSGNIFFDTYNNGAYSVIERPADGSTPITVTTNVTVTNGIAVGVTGTVYIADSGNNRIVVETPTGNSAAPYTQSALITTGLNNPLGVAVDASGTVYVADSNNSRVVSFAPNGGGAYTGPTTLITTTTSGLYDIAVGSTGTLYIADTGNNRILAETPASGGRYAQTVVTSGTSSPQGVTVDSNGVVYVADTGNNRVLSETPNGSGGYTEQTLTFVDVAPPTSTMTPIGAATNTTTTAVVATATSVSSTSASATATRTNTTIATSTATVTGGSVASTATVVSAPVTSTATVTGGSVASTATVTGGSVASTATATATRKGRPTTTPTREASLLLTVSLIPSRKPTPTHTAARLALAKPVHLIVVTVRTLTRARITLTLQAVSVSSQIVHKGAKRQTVVHKTVVFNVTVRGTANAHGLWSTRLRARAAIHAGLSLQITVAARSGKRIWQQTATIALVSPPRHR